MTLSCHVLENSSTSVYTVSSSRLDVLLHDTMSASSSLVKLWSCVRSLPIILHGQASVERGFSINKQVEIDNLDENSFVAQCLICDHVNSVGGIKNIDHNNKKLLASASSPNRNIMPTWKMRKRRKSLVAGKRSEKLYVMKLMN